MELETVFVAHSLLLTKFNNTRPHDGSPMRHPTPTLRFVSSYSNIITADINGHRIHDPRRLRLVGGRFHQLKLMATKNDSFDASGIKDGSEKKKGEEELAKKQPPPPPPPPEKPEAGDCCGSGCVRCVWDVYYEELEAYNKLCKSDVNDSNPKSS